MWNLSGRKQLALCVLLLFPSAARAAITGVCPDGSIFIVQSPSAIPCARAKRMEPHEVPPLRPEHLPRPYTWQVYEEAGDPQNPYHLLDAAREVRALRDGRSPATPRAGQGAAPGDAAALGPQELGLTEGELRDLFFIVELAQQKALASFLQETADGQEVLRVSFAHSQAFEERFQRGRPGTGSRVLVFSAVARQTTSFHAMFSFVQGHIAFHPEAGSADQFGILQGRVGDMPAGDAVLGYVVLPASLDLEQPMDVYWNDRLTTVTFEP